MSTRCQIEFRSGDVRRTVYRHWDGYPSAVIPDLLAFLAWSTRHGDVEYESANFLYWSKRDLGQTSEQLGFGICANDELHGDVEFYYVVRYEGGACTISAHEVEHSDGEVRVGRLVAVAPAPFFSSEKFKSNADRCGSVARALPRVLLDGVWYFRDDRLREFRRVDSPHDRITFDDLLNAA